LKEVKMGKRYKTDFFDGIKIVGSKIFVEHTKKALNMEPKTKIIVNFLKTLKLVGKNNLIILKKLEKNNLILAMRNISNATFVDVNSLNPYLILKSSSLIFVENALEVFTSKPKNVNK